MTWKLRFCKKEKRIEYETKRAIELYLCLIDYCNLFLLVASHAWRIVWLAKWPGGCARRCLIKPSQVIVFRSCPSPCNLLTVRSRLTNIFIFWPPAHIVMRESLSNLLMFRRQSPFAFQTDQYAISRLMQFHSTLVFLTFTNIVTEFAICVYKCTSCNWARINKWRRLKIIKNW